MYKVIEHDPILGSVEWTIRTCRSCDGTGRTLQHKQTCDLECPACDGAGETATSRDLEITHNH